MGRGVETPARAVAIAYYDASWMGYHDYDEDGEAVELKEYNEDIGRCDWEWYVEDVIERVKANWPSFEDVSGENKWLSYPYRENKIILENCFAEVTISEYCGAVAISLIPKESDGYYDSHQMNNLGKGFCSRIAEKFEKEFSSMVKLGSFSDGTSLYKKR